MTELFVADVTLRHHPINYMRCDSLRFGYHLFLCFNVISQVKIAIATLCTKDIYSVSFVVVIFQSKVNVDLYSASS